MSDILTPDELRALAEALDRLKFRCDGIDDACLVEDAADYLRACADAKPVAWRTFDGEGNYDYRAHELNEDYADEWNRRNPNHVGWVEPLYTHPAPAAPAGWKWVPVEPTPEMLSAVGMMDGYDWHAPGCSPDADHANWYSAMIAAAPAASQAEPVSDPRPCTCHPDDSPPVPCARKYALSECRAASGEPKRNQPLRDLLAVIHCDGGHHTEAVGLDQSIKDAQAAVCELKRELAMAKREPLTDERIAEIQRAAYERAAQECIETAAELRRCADGCTDGRYDWKADGAADCADAIRALGRQQ